MSWSYAKFINTDLRRMFASVRSKKEWSRWSIGRTSTMDAYLVQQLHMRPRQRKLSQNIMFYYLEWKFWIFKKWNYRWTTNHNHDQKVRLMERKNWSDELVFHLSHPEFGRWKFLQHTWEPPILVTSDKKISMNSEHWGNEKDSTCKANLINFFAFLSKQVTQEL